LPEEMPEERKFQLYTSLLNKFQTKLGYTEELKEYLTNLLENNDNVLPLMPQSLFMPRDNQEMAYTLSPEGILLKNFIFN